MRHNPGSGFLCLVAYSKAMDIPIPGTTRMAHSQENLGSADLEFTQEEFRDLDNDTFKVKKLEILSGIRFFVCLDKLAKEPDTYPAFLFIIELVLYYCLSLKKGLGFFFSWFSKMP